MADITKIRLDNNDYDIKDASARSDISTLDTRVEALENKIDFSNLKTVQDLIYTPLGSGHNFQGSFVDNNNILYVYNDNNDPYGDLYRFDVQTHTLVNTVSNLKFYHGNDFTFKDNIVYVAPYTDDNGNATNKTFIKYDLTNNTLTTLPAFSGISYTATFGIAYNGDDLIVALTQGDINKPSQNKYVKYEISTGNYTEYTVKLNGFYIDGCQNCGIEIVNNKMYLLTTSKNIMYQFDIDDVNNVLSLNKIYALGDKDDLGIDYCEFQSISKLPSGLYGEDAFILTTDDFDNESHAAMSLKVYLTKLSSNLNPFIPANTTNYNQQRRVDIYVNLAGGSNLLENGSSDYPFKSLTRAVQFANSDQNVAVRDINIVGNSATYYLGKQTNKNISIYWTDSTIVIEELVNCNLHLAGANNNTAILSKLGGGEYMRFKTCRGQIQNFKTSDRIRIDTGSTMMVRASRQTVSVSENMVVDNSIVILDPTDMSGGTTRILDVDNGSSVQISNAFGSINKRARNGSNIVVASS